MLGRILLTLEDVMLLFGASAGWNETRIHNPRWPPHARFRNAQIMTLSIMLGIATLFLPDAATRRLKGPRTRSASRASLSQSGRPTGRRCCILGPPGWISSSAGWVFRRNTSSRRPSGSP
ncbi:hypothetical protein CGRA01v4_13366 [Colletotrichum graminicola]|nr:hypothetical protein CGRA01v4_13366 [Colletotrichum graminicola]